MGLFSKIKGMFDTGGVKVSIESHGEFAWGDPWIPTRVTLQGNAEEPRFIESLDFTLKDEADPSAGRAPGMRDPMARQRPDGWRVDMRWQYPLGLQLAPGESRRVEVQVPFSQGEGPSWLQSMQVADGSITFGRIRWYELAVHAPVRDAKAAPGDRARLKSVKR